jgi:hypothetical protein
MSTQTQQFSTLTAIPERRFYPRIAPQAPVFVDLSENKPEDAILLNVSENGLLVSSPNRLTSNFVTRLSLPLKGLPKPVQVTVRVVWASEAQHLAGIQLLDLSEHDRQQIRKWASRESVPSSLPATDDPLQALPSSATDDPLLASASSATYSEPDQASESVSNTFAIDSSSDTATAAEPLAAPEIVSERPASTAARRVLRVALLAAACLAATVLLIKAAPRIPFAKFSEYRRPPSIAGATLEKNVQPISVPTASPVDAKPNAPAPSPTPAPSTSPTKPKTPASGTPAKPQPPQIEQATADDDEADSADAPEEHHADSPAETSSSAPPETAPAAPAAPAPPESAAVAPAPSAIAKPLPATDPKGSAALPPAVPPATSTIPPSAPTVAPARPTLSPRPAVPALQPVIQMDAPPNRTLQVHLPSGYQAPYFSLPGERILESPTLTTHIQRSVHLSAGWSFHRNKKVVVGELISRVDPPPAQFSSGTDASVRVKATVTKDGRVENVKLVLGPQNLLPAISQALRQWRYQPTLVDGNPVETQCYLVFQFHAKSYRAAKR